MFKLCAKIREYSNIENSGTLFGEFLTYLKGRTRTFNVLGVSWE